MITTATPRPTGRTPTDPETLIQQRLHGSGELQALAMKQKDLQERLGAAQQKLQEAKRRLDMPSPEEITAVASGSPVGTGQEIADLQREAQVLQAAEAQIRQAAATVRRQIATEICAELSSKHEELVRVFVQAAEAMDGAFTAMEQLQALLRNHDVLQSSAFPVFGRYHSVRPGLRYVAQEFRQFLERQEVTA